MSAVILIVECGRNFCVSFRFPVRSLTILAAECLNVYYHFEREWTPLVRHYLLPLGKSKQSPMPTAPYSPPILERCLALLGRFWAFNMTLVHNRGVQWPGFGYTEAETTEMRSISEGYPKIESYTCWRWWWSLCLLFSPAWRSLV
jgi:hypothetical protein